MSSPTSSRPKPAPNEEVVAEGERKVATSVSADDKSSQAPSNSSKEDSLGASNHAAPTSSVSAGNTSPQPAPDVADQQSDAASAVSNGSQSENKPSRSRTRSTFQSNNASGKQNGEKRYQEQDSSPDSSGAEDEKDPYLNALASTLARLDEGAYKRALFQDANSILEKILFPMSFPWAHRVLPVVRNIPRDIDEMPSILAADDAEHELCALKHSIFDLYQSQVGFEKKELFDDDEKILAVARRADEPGEIELITSAPSIASNGNNPSPNTAAVEDNFSVLLRDPLIEPVRRPVEKVNSANMASPDLAAPPLDRPGEVSYQMFEQVQEKKRRKLEAGMARLKTLRVSVRVDSTSTRHNLFNRSSEQGPLPLLLPATLPDGFRASLKGKSSSRASQGRSQLTWVEKNTLPTSHRVSFKSFLTGEKIENGSQRRPRDVSVGIRVCGKLLSSAQIKTEQLTKENLAASATQKQADGKNKSIYSLKIVSDAVKDTKSKRMCSMDTEAFTKRILSRELNKDKSMGWNNKITIKSLNLVYVTPRIDCIPSEDGLVHVLCTSPGELPASNVDKVFNQACRSIKPSVCTVCWRDTSVTGELLSECSGCGLLLHLESCQSSMSYDLRRRKCASCFQSDKASTSPSKTKKGSAGSPSPERTGRRSSRTPPKAKEGGSPMSGVQPLSCALCPHAGGAMSMVKRDGRTTWVHDVCRIWCDQPTESTRENGTQRTGDDTSADPDSLTCVVCGNSNDFEDQAGIVKCSATGCSVYFHPMCALYISKCEEMGEESQTSSENGASSDTPSAKAEENVNDNMLERIIENDNRLCKQYSLRFAKCAIPDSHYVRTPSMSSAVLPVCFCGIHNPKRDRSLYGLYPGGAKMIDQEVIRVPAKKTTSTK